MSLTLELIEPAGPIVSMTLNGTSTAVLSLSVYGVAKSPPFCDSLTAKLLFFIPIGSRIRVRITSSHDVPATSALRWPAVRNIRFWYWNFSRKSSFGSR